MTEEQLAKAIHIDEELSGTLHTTVGDFAFHSIQDFDRENQVIGIMNAGVFSIVSFDCIKAVTTIINSLHE